MIEDDGIAAGTHHRAHATAHIHPADALGAATTHLRLHGERVTAARIAVLEVLARTSDHISAEAIAHHVATKHSEVHRATVYRTVDRFVELGMLSRLLGPNGASLYHLNVTAGAHEHLHAQCRNCGRVLTVSSDALEAAIASLAPEFVWQPSQSTLIGLCAGCATS